MKITGLQVVFLDYCFAFQNNRFWSSKQPVLKRKTGCFENSLICHYLPLF
ncbi:hypothetical protein HMPREF0653_02594 [Prevotella disiens JCM 6334 = ATCC 29426]|uniref:Uncharacterized protein n=1 Tax=Prevotella disiens JCM 6334 = ATCC 29426 TaxID=1235811 RepID=A0ABP2Y608_9BACT|nr:hypothetical protein HMPREF0653_02594 [Prevotella disiens JCM 6334 = ATCC 29426]